MPGTAVIFGHGPGISHAVARALGRRGHPVALVARSETRLAEAAEGLRKEGIAAAHFAADLADPTQVVAALRKAREALGPVEVLHWNGVARGAPDLLAAPLAELHSALDIAALAVLPAVQEALPDLKAARGAVLLTNGGFGLPVDALDRAAADNGRMGNALGNAVKHKMARVLHYRLKKEGVYAGEVMVMGAVKGTVFDDGSAKISPDEVAGKFLELLEGRNVASVQFPQVKL
ncbi:short-chain dehydrogenase/reductase SDR [Hyaloraphidium curvatum]|nr:short-chain dehydrogenase/reductase SDR [Hyaloraphidium curvatum]